MWVYFWVLHSVPLIYISIVMPVRYFDGKTLYSFRQGKSLFQLIFFPNNILAIQCHLCFHKIFKNICFSSMKNSLILIKISLNLWIVLGSMFILTVFILPTTKHGVFSICFYHFQFLSLVYYSFCSMILLLF